MTKKCILGTGNFALDIIYQREYPEGFDTTKKRNPFVDKKLIEEVGNTCGNVMCMLPYLGVETYPIGHFDESEQGLKITADLKRYGANTRFVKNSKEGGTTLMTCIHKLDANRQHTMSHRATAPNSRFPKRKQLRKSSCVKMRYKALSMHSISSPMPISSTCPTLVLASWPKS